MQLTLWGDHAVASEGEVVEGMVVQATACKVGDYNGAFKRVCVHMCQPLLQVTVMKLCACNCFVQV